MNKIAVVIPTYNRADNLDCILKALEIQTSKPDEVIIVDDGSTDNTHAVAMKYQDVFETFKYYYHPNRGYRLSLNRNQGTRLVAQDTTHVLYLDGDVMLNKKAIEAYRQIIAKEPEAVICGRYDWLDPKPITPDDVVNNWEGIINGS